jgi:hypothetical protein
VFSNIRQKAVDAIRGSNRPTTTAGFLTPIDTLAIAVELNLDDLASERGKANLPASASTQLDSVEQAIIQKIESEWSWQGGELINNLRAYAQRLLGYSIQAEFTNLQIKANDTLSRLREADHRAEADLGPLREEYIGLRDDLQSFRKRNRLTRIARSPAKRWTTFGLLVLFVAVESLFNGVFFAKGAALGLIGGIGIAIGISLSNVVFSFGLGLWPARWINYRLWLVKLIAFIVTVVGLCGIVALHAFSAHYRDAVAAYGEDAALTTAIGTLTTAPWQLADINSYYLFGLGVIFAIGAFYKGATFDDPYPFYGGKYRAVAGVREEYSDVHSELFDDLAEIKEETVKALNDGITRIPLFPQQAANLRTQRAGVVQMFRGYESSVVTAANQLLSKYRDGNRRARQATAPQHFDTSWTLPHSFLEGAEVRTLTTEATAPEMDVGAALDELKRLTQAVLIEYDRLLTSYPHPTKMDGNNASQQA